MLPAQCPPPPLKPMDAHAAGGSERPATHSLVSPPLPPHLIDQPVLTDAPKGTLQPTHALPPLCHPQGQALSYLYQPLGASAAYSFSPTQWPVTTHPLTNPIPTSRSSQPLPRSLLFSSPFAEASLCPLPLLSLQDSAQEFLPQESLTCALTNKDAHTWLHLEAGTDTRATLSHAGLQTNSPWLCATSKPIPGGKYKMLSNTNHGCRSWTYSKTTWQGKRARGDTHTHSRPLAVSPQFTKTEPLRQKRSNAKGTEGPPTYPCHLHP